MFVKKKADMLNTHTHQHAQMRTHRWNAQTRDMCVQRSRRTHTERAALVHKHGRQKAMENLTRRTDHNPWSRSFDSLTAHAVFCVGEWSLSAALDTSSSSFSSSSNKALRTIWLYALTLHKLEKLRLRWDKTKHDIKIDIRKAPAECRGSESGVIVCIWRGFFTRHQSCGKKENDTYSLGMIAVRKMRLRGY